MTPEQAEEEGICGVPAAIACGRLDPSEVERDLDDGMAVQMCNQVAAQYPDLCGSCPVWMYTSGEEADSESP